MHNTCRAFTHAIATIVFVHAPYSLTFPFKVNLGKIMQCLDFRTYFSLTKKLAFKSFALLLDSHFIVRHNEA